jgi:cellulose synthase operon protein C
MAAGSLVGAADEREAALLRAVQAHPAQSGPHRDLAEYYQDHQRPFEALWELAMARESGIVDEAFTLHTAQALKQAGLPGVALRLLAAARDDFRRPAGLSQALAEAELEEAESSAAAQVVAATPALVTTADGLLLLGRAHLALGDFPAARRDWQRARQAAGKQPAGKRASLVSRGPAPGPTSWVPPVAARQDAPPPRSYSLPLGRLALALGEAPAAREELATAARENTADEAAQYYAGLAYSASGEAADAAKAIEYFKAATRADPHQARAGVALGRLLYEKSGQWERAASVYRQALSIDSHCLAAEEGLARVRAALKQPGEVAYHQARICELRSRPAEALQWYRRWGAGGAPRWGRVSRGGECSI